MLTERLAKDASRCEIVVDLPRPEGVGSAEPAQVLAVVPAPKVAALPVVVIAHARGLAVEIGGVGAEAGADDHVAAVVHPGQEAGCMKKKSSFKASRAGADNTVGILPRKISIKAGVSAFGPES